MQILPPYDPGGNLGSSIGSGISSGLQLLAQNKLEDMKQDRKNKLLKKTQAERESRLKERGYPGWLAYEDPSVFKEYMSQFAPSGQEGIDRTLGGGGQSPTGLDLLGGGQESPSAETTPQPTEQMPAGAVEPQGLPTLKSYKEFLQSNPEIRKNAPKLREKSYKQYQDEWHKRKTEAQGEANTNLKRSQQAHTIFNPIREKADKAREDLGSIRIVNELLNKGDFTNPLIAKFYDMLPGGFLEAFKSKDTKALQGLRGDFFATMAKGFYPLSDSDVQEIYKTLISPANTVDQNKMLNGLAELKTAGPILKEKILNNVENDPKYANKTPYDIERMANKRYAEEFKDMFEAKWEGIKDEISSKPVAPEGFRIKESLAKLPPARENSGEDFAGDKPGEVWHSNGRKWQKGRIINGNFFADEQQDQGENITDFGETFLSAR